MNQLNENRINAQKGLEAYGSYTYSIIEKLECGSLCIESTIFKYCFSSMLPHLPHVNAMELVNDKKTWEGVYDEFIKSRLEFTRIIPAAQKAYALDILLECPDRFAEWADVNGEWA